MIQYLVNEIIESSLDNTAGTLLNKKAITKIVNILIKNKQLNKNNVDLLINKYATNEGFMIKYIDLYYVLQDYIINNNIEIYNMQEKPEKDLEIIEILYGEWHAECGDRD